MINRKMPLANYDEVYAYVKKFHSEEPYSDWIKEINTSYLSVTLRPFQVDAVKWMLYKEKCHKNSQVDIMGVEVDLPKGGILADEMGLGKTIEVLTCILNNPYISEQTSNELKYNSSKRKFHENIKNEHDQRKVKICTSQSEPGEEENDSESVTEVKKIKLDSVDTVIEEVIKRYTTPKKSGLASAKYNMLRAWYTTALSEVSATPRARKVRDENTLKCFCNNFSEDLDKVCCTECRTYQHRQCVGLEDCDEEDDYYCPQCWTKKEPIKSRATFIISPTSIANQWECEIKKHIVAEDFKVLVYNGVKGNTYVQPKHLADYDIVITTYNVLCNELNYTNGVTQSDRKLRHAKRFFSATTPLTCIRWWRICLDEAQMVEHFQSKTAMMAHELDAEYRWAVTGTPIQKSIHDLFGLLQFLRIKNFESQTVWMDLVHNKEELHRFLGHILWRSCKKDVLNMLGVPDQKVVHHWLRFSPVEGYFYQRTHNECAYHFRLKLARNVFHVYGTLGYFYQKK